MYTHIHIYFLQDVIEVVRGNFSPANRDSNSQPFFFTVAKTTDCTWPKKSRPSEYFQAKSFPQSKKKCN